MGNSFSALEIAHKAVKDYVRPGGLCIDATAGRGHDTVFLCSLVGDGGRVLAFDIQDAAIKSTTELVTQNGYEGICSVICDSHSNISNYATEGTVDCIMFNLGWLPKGDHSVFTTAKTSIPAIEAGLRLLKPGGIISLCIYYGGQSGFEERDALLEYLLTVDDKKYTVILSSFYNRKNNPPIPVFILKDPRND